MIGGTTALAVRHVGQGHQRMPSSHGVDLLHRVPHGVDVQITGHPGTGYGDSPAGGDVDAGHDGQPGVGPHADRADHQLAGN